MREIIGEQLAAALRRAQRVVAFTGAGISAESGIPTFRGEADSFWSRYDPERLGSADGFLDDPELVWRWYTMRRAKVREAAPNAAHQAVARLERLVPQCTLITQNVDDLHERAGSRNVLRLHGSILETRCFDEERVLAADELQQDGHLPRCRYCGAYARPGVVWFGEALPEEVFARAERALKSADFCLVVGTSAVVHPAAGLINYLPAGAVLAVVNTDPTDHSRESDYFLQARAGLVVPALVRAAFGA